MEEKGGKNGYMPPFYHPRLDSLWQSTHTLVRAVAYSRVPVILVGADVVFQYHMALWHCACPFYNLECLLK